MDRNDATQLLLEHAGIVEGQRMTDGILGMLRPYHGLIERNFHEVISSIYHLYGDLGSAAVSNNIVRSILVILNTLREWGISPTGMLRTNRLIDNDSLIRLGNWYSVVEATTLRYLSRSSHARAMYMYLGYLAGYDVVDTIAEEAVRAAIADSFGLGEDYQLVALAVCAKYPQVGRSFGKLVAQLDSVTPVGDLKNALAVYLNKYPEST
jgi:hypothetical protein